jgi:Flp pilus assembly protein TadD
MPRAPLAFALLAVSAVAADKDPWIQVSSAHFDVFTDAGERAGRDIAKHFEQVHGFFFQRFQTGIDPTRKARVILFRNEKEYEAYRPNQFAAAFYHPGEYRDFIVMNHSASELRPTGVHELTHLMVHQLGTELPLWLNEGLAELYSNMEPRGAQMMVGRDIPGRMNALATQQWIDLPTLLAVTQASPIYNDKSRAGIFYAESWKLVHMLHLHPAYEAHLGDLVRGLAKGDAAGAFRAAYGKSLDEVQADLIHYLGGGTINAMLFNIQLSKSLDTPDIAQSASLPARLAIAELLSNSSGRSDQASAAYEAISHDFPDRWEVEEAMGLFAWHERRMNEASVHFAKAEALGCTKGSMFLLWGRVLSYSNRLRDAVAVLGKAVEMLPDSIETRLVYGDVLIRSGDWGAAIATLRGVKNVPAAAAWRYTYNLAYGLYRMGDLDSARPLVAVARKYAANPRETSSLDQLEAALNRPARSDAVSIEGTLEEMECGKFARLHVRSGEDIRVFVMPDPRTLPSVNLPCGPQKNPRRLRVEFQPLPAGSDANGLVRALEFR